MDKIYTTTVTSRPALPRSRYRTSVAYSGGSSAAQGGSSGSDGKDGVGIASVETTGSSASGGVNVVTISLTDGTSSKFNVRNGYDGAAGKSAYEVAVDEGFDGTEADWLESLRGKPGSRGGIGPEGKSAYEIAVKEGFEGDELEWLDSLKGTPGQSGKDGTSGPAAGFGTPSASAVSVPSGMAPSVEVTASGPDIAKVFDFIFRIPRAASGGGSAEVLTYPEYLDMPARDEDTLYAVTYQGKCDLYLGDIRITDNITAVLPSSILLSGPDGVAGGKGATALYTASLLPDNVTETGLKWSCSTTDGAASIDQDGLLTALGRGTVIVIAASVARPIVKAVKSVSINLTMRLVMTGQGFDASRSSAYKYLLVSDELQSLGLALVSSDFDGEVPTNGGTVDAAGVANLRDVIIGSPTGIITFFLSETADVTQAVEVASIDASSLGQSIVDAWDAVAAGVTVNTAGDAVALTGLSVSGDSTVGNAGNKAQYNVEYTPSNTTQRGVIWSVTSGSAYASIDESGLLTVKSGANGNAVTIRATSKENTSIYAEKTISVTYAAGPDISFSDDDNGVINVRASDTSSANRFQFANIGQLEASVTGSLSGASASVNDDGETSGEVRVTFAANTSSSERRGTVTVTGTRTDGKGAYSKSFVIIQAAAAVTETYLRVAPATINAPADRTQFTNADGTLTIEANQSWTAEVTSGDDWLDIDAVNGTGDGTNGIMLLESNTGSERTGTILFTGADGKTATVTVIQAAAVTAPSITFQNDSMEVAAAAGTVTNMFSTTGLTDLTVTATGGMTITVGPSISGYQIGFAYAANSDSVSKTTTVTLTGTRTDGQGTYSKSFTVTQSAGAATELDPSISLLQDTFRVPATTTSVTQRFSSKNLTGLTATVTGALEGATVNLNEVSKTIVVNFRANTTSLERVGTVTVTGTRTDGNGTYSKSFTVTQAASTAGTYLLTVNVSPSDASVSVQIGAGSLTTYREPVRVAAEVKVVVVAIKSGYVSRGETVTMDSDKTLDWTLQVAPSWTLTSQTVVDTGDDIPFRITDEENVGWRVECPSWCSFENGTASGIGATSMLLSVDANDTGVERSGYVYLYVAGSSSVVKACKITQAAF